MIGKMTVDDVIKYLEDAKKTTFSENYKFRFNQAIEALYTMKHCNQVK